MYCFTHSCLPSARLRLSVKINDEYKPYKELPPALLAQQTPVGPARPNQQRKAITAGRKFAHVSVKTTSHIVTHVASSDTSMMIASIDNTPKAQPSTFATANKLSEALTLHKTTRTIKPKFHPQWKLVRVISGHLGWVRSAAVEPGNQWFATGAGDRVIKIWDLASGELKLSLTGHISTVRGLAISPRHPYLFSAGEDKVRSFLSGSVAVPYMHLFPDGQMLGPGSEQGDPALSWTPFWGLFSQSTSDARRARHLGQRRISARMGYADESTDIRPVRSHRYSC